MGVDSVVDWTWRRVRDELKDREIEDREIKDPIRTTTDRGDSTTLDRSIQLEAYEEYADELEIAPRRRRVGGQGGSSARGAPAPRRVRVIAQAPRAPGELVAVADAVANVRGVCPRERRGVAELSRNLSGSRPRELYDDEQEEMEA